MTKLPKTEITLQEGEEAATFGAGCFWCTEAIYKQLKGVNSVQSGFSGGHVELPSYKDVVRGDTGHAEVVHLRFDPALLSFEDLLQVFFSTHDPTTLNRQGADVGPQYRSAVFYHDETQKLVAEKVKGEFERNKYYDSPIVTEISPFDNFYPAEAYHNDYFELNGQQPYCQFVIKPKVEKFRKAFMDKLKK